MSNDSDLEQLFTKIKQRRVRRKLLSSVLQHEHSSPVAFTLLSSLIKNVTEDVSTVSELYHSIIFTPILAVL